MEFKPKKLKFREYLLMSAIITSGIIIDQLSKIIATEYLAPVKSVPIIDGVFNFTYHTNPGAAWGMLADSRWIFMTVSAVAIIAMVLYLYAGLSERLLYTVSLCLIISGGIGNMIDRTVYGKVVDFLDFCLIDFPIFNIADSLVCIGAGMLILALVEDMINEGRALKKKKTAPQIGDEEDNGEDSAEGGGEK